MYKLEIKTKYNTIQLDAEDLKDEKVLEILSQEYIQEVKIEKIKEEIKKLEKKL